MVCVAYSRLAMNNILKHGISIAILGAGLLSVGELAAEQKPSAGILLWQDTSLSYLLGEQFKVDPARQQTLTLEHAAGWSFGDSFFFFDFIDYRDNDWGDNSYYGEFSPRFSVNKLTDAGIAFGPVRDLLLATTLEFGEGDTETFLFGPGLDLNLPGFDYFQLNLYYREGLNNKSNGWQLTPVWSITLPIGKSEIVFDGFIDYVFATQSAGYSNNLHICPQLKYNLGKAIWGEQQRLYLGVEFDYWTNKYGIKSSPAFKTDQFAYSFLVKYHL